MNHFQTQHVRRIRDVLLLGFPWHATIQLDPVPQVFTFDALPFRKENPTQKHCANRQEEDFQARTVNVPPASENVKPFGITEVAIFWMPVDVFRLVSFVMSCAVRGCGHKKAGQAINPIGRKNNV